MLTDNELSEMVLMLQSTSPLVRLSNMEARTVCVSAWNKDPVFGVIGIQSGPRDKGPQWLPSSHG
ncbi:hypothetical protein, partial [Bradyrhizobium liaoningense]|uniref:hypothetical protein n=1 Tax=Bradyrhizobium liaoningense TaxID=43992 RepID=UPI001BAB9AA1